jgi:hypothetical protein
MNTTTFVCICCGRRLDLGQLGGGVSIDICLDCAAGAKPGEAAGGN